MISSVAGALTPMAKQPEQFPYFEASQKCGAFSYL